MLGISQWNGHERTTSNIFKHQNLHNANNIAYQKAFGKVTYNHSEKFQSQLLLTRHEIIKANNPHQSRLH